MPSTWIFKKFLHHNFERLPFFRIFSLFSFTYLLKLAEHLFLVIFDFLSTYLHKVAFEKSCLSWMRKGLLIFKHLALCFPGPFVFKARELQVLISATSRVKAIWICYLKKDLVFLISTKELFEFFFRNLHFIEVNWGNLFLSERWDLINAKVEYLEVLVKMVQLLVLRFVNRNACYFFWLLHYFDFDLRCRLLS